MKGIGRVGAFLETSKPGKASGVLKVGCSVWFLEKTDLTFTELGTEAALAPLFLQMLWDSRCPVSIKGAWVSVVVVINASRWSHHTERRGSGDVGSLTELLFFSLSIPSSPVNKQWAETHTWRFARWYHVENRKMGDQRCPEVQSCSHWVAANGTLKPESTGLWEVLIHCSLAIYLQVSLWH